MKKEYTNRGFSRYNFKDQYGFECSLQKSSLATDDAIWLGVNDPNLVVFEGESKGKYVETKMPEQFSVHSRMHLTQEQVKMLLPILQNFAETGEI